MERAEFLMVSLVYQYLDAVRAWRPRDDSSWFDSSWLLRRARDCTTFAMRMLTQAYSLKTNEDVFAGMSACRLCVQEAVKRHMNDPREEKKPEPLSKLLIAMQKIEYDVLTRVISEDQVNMLSLWQWCTEPILRRFRYGSSTMSLRELPAWPDVRDHVLLVGELLSLETHPDPYAVLQHIELEDLEQLQPQRGVAEAVAGGVANAVALPEIEPPMSQDSQEETQVETQA